jgi:excisionase family DNA binding protein
MAVTDELLTLPEVADRLRVSGAHIRKLVREGSLVPTFRIGEAKRFSWLDVQRQLGPATPAVVVNDAVPAAV